MMCNKCKGIMGWLLLILGILFLLQDLGTWNFWGISWYTALFLVFGLGKICGSSCPSCDMKKKKK